MHARTHTCVRQTHTHTRTHTHTTTHTTRHALVLGQDKRELGVLVFPDQEAVAAAGLDEAPASALQAALATVVAELNGARPDYVPHEHVAALQVRLHAC
jgi:hypothetical protein